MAKKPKNKNRGPQKPAQPVVHGGSGKMATAAVTADAADSDADDAFDATAFDASSTDASATAPDTDAVDATPDTLAASEAGSDGALASRPFVAVPAPAFDASLTEVIDSGFGSGSADDIRGVLIQLASARLLLPNATIAEVLSYAEPDAIPGAPDWLLGRIRWRGWQLPLIAFSRLAGISEERGGLGSKVVVLKALGGGKTPYFAVLTQGFPRLVTVSRAALLVDETATDLPTVILAHVTLNQDDAYLPDLERVEAMIGEALARAA